MKKRYFHAPAVLLAVAVGVILLTLLFMRFGSTRTAVRLEEPDKASELDGFAMYGVAGDDRYTQQFQLKDGVLKSAFTFKSIQQTIGYSTQHIWPQLSYAVDPSKAKQVDSAAVKVGDRDYRSECDSFQTVVNVSLSDETFVRFCYGEPIQLPKPIPVMSTLGKFYSHNVFPTVETLPETDRLPVTASTGGFQCNEKTFVYVGGTPNTPAAIYEVVSSIDYKAIEKLPKDGTVAGKKWLLPTTPYGEVKKVVEYPLGTYITQAMSTQGLIAVGIMQGESIGVDLLRFDGSREDIVGPQVELSDSGMITNELLTGAQRIFFYLSPADDEICFFAPNPVNPYEGSYGALRVKEDKVVASCFVKGYIDPTPDENGNFETNSFQAMALNESNDAILVARSRVSARIEREDGSVVTLGSGVTLSAYRAGESKPYAYNVLVCNEEDDSIVHTLYPKEKAGALMRGYSRFFNFSEHNDANDFLYFQF